MPARTALQARDPLPRRGFLGEEDLEEEEEDDLLEFGGPRRPARKKESLMDLLSSDPPWAMNEREEPAVLKSPPKTTGFLKKSFSRRGSGPTTTDTSRRATVLIRPPAPAAPPLRTSKSVGSIPPVIGSGVRFEGVGYPQAPQKKLSPKEPVSISQSQATRELADFLRSAPPSSSPTSSTRPSVLKNKDSSTGSLAGSITGSLTGSFLGRNRGASSTPTPPDAASINSSYTLTTEATSRGPLSLDFNGTDWRAAIAGLPAPPVRPINATEGVAVSPSPPQSVSPSTSIRKSPRKPVPQLDPDTLGLSVRKNSTESALEMSPSTLFILSHEVDEAPRSLPSPNRRAPPKSSPPTLVSTSTRPFASLAPKRNTLDQEMEVIIAAPTSPLPSLPVQPRPRINSLTKKPSAATSSSPQGPYVTPPTASSRQLRSVPAPIEIERSNSFDSIPPRGSNEINDSEYLYVKIKNPTESDFDSPTDPQSAAIIEEENRRNSFTPRGTTPLLHDDPFLSAIQALQASMLKLGNLELPLSSPPSSNHDRDASRRSSTTFGYERRSHSQSRFESSGSSVELLLPFLEGMQMQMSQTALLLDFVIKQAKSERSDEDEEEAGLVSYLLDHGGDMNSDSGIGEEMEEKEEKERVGESEEVFTDASG